MLRIFQHDINDPDHFVVTLELVPRRASFGRSVDKILAIAKDAFADGRISAVSITDNPGGNPSLSPDVLGRDVFSLGMDVIVHFTCRDMNRIGLESRALQLSRMGMKNILALTGDYPGKGFGGQGAPVYDLDSVNLTCMLSMLSRRLYESGDPDEFFTGCAVSPFKTTEGEGFAQYAKLCRKVNAGASFVITQLGYDSRKYEELTRIIKNMNLNIPVLGSVYLLSPKAARAMNKGLVPGAVVPDHLFNQVQNEWKDKKHGLKLAVERTAKLAVTLKKLGYKGIHIGGVHRSYKTVANILDRMDEIEKTGEDFFDDFNFSGSKTYYAFPDNLSHKSFLSSEKKLSILEKLKFRFLKKGHDIFFSFDSPVAPLCRMVAEWIDKRGLGRWLKILLEDPVKGLLLSCQKCGDCGIQHLAFQCPESGCPKHTRNGACGGSKNGMCEVFPDKRCVWEKAYHRLASVNQTDVMTNECIPPRMWELDHTSSWLNFHLKRDHQSKSSELIKSCSSDRCRFDSARFH
ncbi:MAG: methylenetetrahydrofolate reductase C-terminal domain-containing protein [Deltaproteobacteria bacterium]|nr:methylenetetrahydrofolate reductase C-terminal domain-containing protein [Deltaproteobacteria bacterium]